MKFPGYWKRKIAVSMWDLDLGQRVLPCCSRTPNSLVWTGRPTTPDTFRERPPQSRCHRPLVRAGAIGSLLHEVQGTPNIGGAGLDGGGKRFSTLLALINACSRLKHGVMEGELSARGKVVPIPPGPSAFRPERTLPIQHCGSYSGPSRRRNGG